MAKLRRDDRPVGKLKQAASESWYVSRLGGFDAEGNLNQTGLALVRAIDLLVDLFMGEGQAPERYEYRERLASPDAAADEPEVYWVPGHVGGPKLYGPAPDRPTRRHLLGNVWRGHLAHRVGKGKAEHILGSSGALRQLALMNNGRDLLGLPQKHVMQAPGLTVVPRSDQWLRVGTGPIGIRYLVIDLDNKEGTSPAFPERLALFTEVIEHPRPVIIVTSRGGYGRHLFYAMDHATDETEPQRCAVAFKRAIEQRLGISFAAGLIEVFPYSQSPLVAMPAIPFGVGSKLCDQHGVEIESDPLAGLLRWSGFWKERYFLGSTLDEFSAPIFAKIPRVLRNRIRSAITARKQNAKVKAKAHVIAKAGAERPKPGAASRSGPVLKSTGEPVLSTKPTTPVPRPSEPSEVDIAESVLEQGFDVSASDEQMKLVVRYLRFNRGITEVAAETKVLALARQHGISAKDAKSRFQTLWKTARFPVKGTPVCYRLGVEDLVWVAEHILARRQKRVALVSPPGRKAVLRFWLMLIGLARSHHGTLAGRCPEIPLSARLMAEWSREYRSYCDLIGNIGFIEQTVPPSRNEGRCARYRIELPLVTTLTTMQSEPEAWAFILKSLPSDQAVALFGERTWKRWQRSEATKDGAA